MPALWKWEGLVTRLYPSPAPKGNECSGLGYCCQVNHVLHVCTSTILLWCVCRSTLTGHVLNIVIATRQTEGNYQQVAKDVATLMKDYNTLLCQSMSGVTVPTAT